MSKKNAKKIICANWKMNPLTLKEAGKLFKDIARNISHIKKTEVVIFPPFIYLENLRGLSKKISLGAQDAFYNDVGAFTGEVSGEMLYGIGIRYVILGHSERRELGENNSDINKKLKAVLSASLMPILCVGEKKRDDSHEYFNFIKTQIKECLYGINKNLISKIIVAYEPIWAISSTTNHKDANAVDSNEMAVFIRKVLTDIATPEIANETQIIYGGSVNPKDVKDFLQNGGVDGVLVGKASLNMKKFIEIINISESL